MSDLRDILKEIELFHGLDDDQFTRIAALGQQRISDTGTVIFAQNSPGDAIYVISRGQVEVRLTMPTGEEVTAVYLGPGQVFGEMALVDQGRRSASIIVAEDDTMIYAIPTPAFTQLCETDTAIGYIMMRNIAQDLSFKLRHRDFDPTSS